MRRRKKKEKNKISERGEKKKRDFIAQKKRTKIEPVAQFLTLSVIFPFCTEPLLL